MMKVTKAITFDAAHKLYNPEWGKEKNREVYGNCSNLHGHRYKIIISVKGDIDEDGMMINFVDLKKIINKEIISPYDHKDLNTCEDFQGMITTAENMGAVIWKKLKKAIDQTERSIELYELTLYETENSCVTITGDL